MSRPQAGPPPDPEILVEALRDLEGPQMTIAQAEAMVPESAGLYAIHGGAATWVSLALGEPPDHRPLYVGKAESSLAGRDVRTHFATGKTGSSTLRRSVAGLLAEQLGLKGRPRNPDRPERFANFGLEVDGDARLTQWMLSHLRLSVWLSQPEVVLDDVETAVLGHLVPPLNMAKVSSPWKPLVDAGRRRLADQARDDAVKHSGF